MQNVKPLHQVTQDAIRVLSKEMGIVDTLRFINQFNIGYGNYTEEREQLFSGMTLHDIVSAIEQHRP